MCWVHSVQCTPIPLKFGDGDGPNLCRVKKVDVKSTFDWKNISVSVDPRQFLRLFLSGRLKINQCRFNTNFSEKKKDFSELEHQTKVSGYHRTCNFMNEESLKITWTVHLICCTMYYLTWELHGPGSGSSWHNEGRVELLTSEVKLLFSESSR